MSYRLSEGGTVHEGDRSCQLVTKSMNRVSYIPRGGNFRFFVKIGSRSTWVGGVVCYVASRWHLRGILTWGQGGHFSEWRNSVSGGIWNSVWSPAYIPLSGKPVWCVLLSLIGHEKYPLSEECGKQSFLSLNGHGEASAERQKRLFARFFAQRKVGATVE